MKQTGLPQRLVLTALSCVLLFPPVSSYRRLLIHRAAGRLAAQLATFSIGLGPRRRTVVCYRDQLLSDEARATTDMGLTPAERDDATITRSGAVGAGKLPDHHAVRCGPTKPRRPDRAVYVPRALRSAAPPPPAPPPHSDAAAPTPLTALTALTAADTNTITNEAKPECKRSSQSEPPKCPKSPARRDRSSNSTPRKSIDKTYCNVYTPPHLRNQRSHTAPSIDRKDAGDGDGGGGGAVTSVPSGCRVPNSHSVSDNSCNNSVGDIGQNFYIGDYFTNGQLGSYTPNCYGECGDKREWGTDEGGGMAGSETGSAAVARGKDEDAERGELRRASRRMSRGSRRIIKQSFDSDVLVISDPADAAPPPEPDAEPEREPEREPEPKKPKARAEGKRESALRREDNDWEAVFTESGECLDPTLLEELSATVGRVRISAARHTAGAAGGGAAARAQPGDEALAHVVEVYDFPSEFKTHDLLALFSEYKEAGFEIKWVDDTHALIVFSSAKIAEEALSRSRSLARCRPLHAATPESRSKARKCAEFLQPYRQRPETCAALARRLVTGALGVRLSTAPQERAEERRLITMAREKKRQAALHKEAAWDGSLANHSVTQS